MVARKSAMMAPAGSARGTAGAGCAGSIVRVTRIILIKRTILSTSMIDVARRSCHAFRDPDRAPAGHELRRSRRDCQARGSERTRDAVPFGSLRELPGTIGHADDGRLGSPRR